MEKNADLKFMPLSSSRKRKVNWTQPSNCAFIWGKEQRIELHFSFAFTLYWFLAGQTKALSFKYFLFMSSVLLATRKSANSYGEKRPTTFPSPWTGNLTLDAYEDDCEFADPAGSFRGLRRFKRNCTNFGSLIQKSNMKLMKWEDLEVSLLWTWIHNPCLVCNLFDEFLFMYWIQDKGIGHWRFSCVLSFPWKPILSGIANNTKFVLKPNYIYLNLKKCVIEY